MGTSVATKELCRMATHELLDTRLTHAVSLDTQELDPGPTVSPPGLRSGSGFAGWIVVLRHVDLSEGFYLRGHFTAL